MVGSSIRTMIQNKHQNQHKNVSLSTKWSFQSPDLNPKENEWSERKRSSTNMELGIWRIWRDSVWRNGHLLISCQVFSKLIRHYRKRLRAVILAKGGCKKFWINGANNCGQRVLEKNIYFIMWFPPPLIFSCYKTYVCLCLFWKQATLGRTIYQ